MKNEKGNLKVGTFIASERSFGFIEIEGEEKDVFVAPEYKKSAMDGDTVSFRIINNATEREESRR